jgi:hypothetical protein
MRKADIEAWALRVIDRAVNKQPNEDASVELKSDWPTDYYKTARQIAAHANAARGESILWLMGVDQKKGVTGADSLELANWWPGVRTHFDELYPTMQADLNIPWQGLTVVALLFETDRAPFLIRIPQHGSRDGPAASLEVPWREGTNTRSAKRSDLLRLLVPLQRSPSFEALRGTLISRKLLDASTKPIALDWQANLTLYVSPRAENRVVIPFHKCGGTLDIAGALPAKSFDLMQLHPPLSMSSGGFRLLSETINSTPHELIINGPGMLELFCKVQTPLTEGVDKEAMISVSLWPVDAERPVSISVTLQHRPDGKADYGPWVFP